MSSNQNMLSDDDELRHSLRTIERQRAAKKYGVLIGLVLALGLGFLAVTLAYNDTPDGAKSTQSL
ncbi:MAG: hypothetical protein R3B13_20630 [Polyangiaceae bacterium]